MRFGTKSAPSSDAARSWSSDHPESTSSPKWSGATPSQSPSAPNALSSTPATSAAKRPSNVPLAPPTVNDRPTSHPFLRDGYGTGRLDATGLQPTGQDQ